MEHPSPRNKLAVGHFVHLENAKLMSLLFCLVLQLPTIIADNAGYDSADLVAQLRAAHVENKTTYGLGESVCFSLSLSMSVSFFLHTHTHTSLHPMKQISSAIHVH